jgi:hypothetical protein
MFCTASSSYHTNNKKYFNNNNYKNKARKSKKYLPKNRELTTFLEVEIFLLLFSFFFF